MSPSSGNILRMEAFTQLLIETKLNEVRYTFGTAFFPVVLLLF